MDLTIHAMEAPFAPGCGVTDEERRIIVETMAKGTYGWILLATADLDGVFEWLQIGGVPGYPNTLFSQRGGGSQCRRDDDNTRSSPQANQRG